MARPTRQAFSFAELIIAILIIGVGSIPVFTMFSRGSTGTMQTRDEVLAYNYAADLLSWAQTRPYDQLAPTNDAPSDSLSLAPTAGPPVLLVMESGFKRFLTVKEATPAPSGGKWPFAYKVLVAKVQWNPAGGINREIEMTTIVYRGQN